MNGVKYKIIITNDEFKFYAEKLSNIDDDRILVKIKLVLNIFNEIVQKLSEENIKINNVVMIKYVDGAKDVLEKEKIIINEEIKDVNGIGYTIRYNGNIEDSLLLCSYFNDYKKKIQFLSDLSNNVDKLYGVSMEQ